MDNLIAILVVVGILAAAAGYVIRAKKKGAACIGCPGGGQCGGGCTCGEHTQDEDEKE